MSLVALDKEMKRAILKHCSGDERFTFSFVLVDKNLNLERQFNLNRPINEKISVFMRRLNTNVEKVIP